MKQIYSQIIIAAFLVVVSASNLSAQTGPFPDADPSVITITKQGPGDPAPTGTSISISAVLKFRVANNSATTAATGKIPAGAVFYTVQFNPYYTYTSLVPTSQFAVTFAAPGPPDYVVQLTNTVDINPGDVFDFYLNVIATQATNSPTGEIVTLNNDRTLPIACGNTQTGNDNVFKSFTVVSAGPLPVNYLDLQAVLTNQGQVDLKWTTIDEVNVRSFDLERSVDGRNFTTVVNKAAAGTTTGNTDYTHLDNIQQVQSSILYYRVKGIDNDGRHYYSKIVTVTLGKITGLQVWPNPFDDRLSFRIPVDSRGTATVRLYNSTGVLVRSRQAVLTRGTNFVTLDGLAQLSRGIYIAEVIVDGKRILQEKLVK